MKSLHSNKLKAFTLIELLVVALILVLCACIMIPSIAHQRRRATQDRCVNNLKQVGLAFRTFAVDQFDGFSTQLSVTSGGSKEFATTGQVFVHFRLMSNELCSD